MTVKDAKTWIVAEALEGPGEATASGQSTAVEVEELPERPLFILIARNTGGDGDETYDADVEGRDDASESWTTVGSFDQVAQGDGGVVQVKDLQDFGTDVKYREYRLNETLAGTTPVFERTALIVGDELAHVGTAAT